VTILSQQVFGLLFLLTALTPSDRWSYQPRAETCEHLYVKQRFSTLVIGYKPILQIRDHRDSTYEILWQEGYRQTQTVRLFKNTTGLTLRKYVQPGDMIKKVKGEYTVTIARQLNGGLDVQQFDLSCEN
jgi:hypothetical protein